jgi:crotonobetainyl-CoA:carnitine CoA-transferase CaiB-like acyl-CoA transferase
VSPDDGLAGLRVVDFSTQIAGPYCSKLMADAGAEVVKVEGEEGDSLRRQCASGAELGRADSALFRYLNAGKRSVRGAPEDAHVAALVAEADLVIEAHGLEGDNGARLDPARLRAEHPALVVLSITPYGCRGPWAGRRATEFTLQAEAGSIGLRAVPGGVPFQAGGRIAEWAAGAYGAAAALAALFGARRTGRGEHVDLSILETANMIFATFSETTNRLLNGGPGDPEHAYLLPGVETPSVERSADGYVGFCTNSPEQFANFLRLIERPDLLTDRQLATVAGRMARFEEWTAVVAAWCAPRRTEEIVSLASALRIPVAPVLNGETVLGHEQLRARQVFVTSADGGFLQPRRPYLVDGAQPPPPRPAPALGGAGEPVSWEGEGRWAPYDGGVDSDAGLPLSGLKVLDLTAWWAGPVTTHLLASMGATVVHLESTTRLDGMRGVGRAMGRHYEQWWEVSPHFMHANANKLGVTLELSDPRGRALLERLAAWCDVLVENFTPRVVEGFGLGWERFHRLNPEALMVRMPAFGLSGPWRDRPGFAQTIEQLAGLAWVTGHPEDQPRVPRGPCDPVAGMHGAFALLVAMALRARTGRGHLVESPLAEAALNIAAEQVVEWTAYRRLLGREGNRSALAAPQGLYPCAEDGPGEGPPTARWLALSVTSDEQWRALRSAMGDPPWAADPAFDTHAGRRARHDALDAGVAAWTRTRRRAELAMELRRLGIVASEVADPSRLIQANPQLRHRRYFETPEHPVAGAMPLPGMPYRFEGVERWTRTPAPTLGRDNRAVLCEMLGVSDDEYARLCADGVIGTRPLRAGARAGARGGRP